MSHSLLRSIQAENGAEYDADDWLERLSQIGCVVEGSNEESIENYNEAEILISLELPKEINETSGLEIINNNFITHNDSGGDPVVYEFNQNGVIINRHNINGDSGYNLENVDWEDLGADGEYLYIADTGNNFGTRKDLKLIKVDPSNNFQAINEINISYKDQESFLPQLRHKFDAEGLTICLLYTSPSPRDS